MLASVAVGAVAGGLVGKFVDHRLEHEIHHKIGENLPPGSAGILAVFEDEQRLAVEQALGGALLQSVVQSDKSGVEALKDSLAEAIGTGWFGSIAEYPGPFPGYTAARPRSCTALPRILRENCYVTGGFGKWRLTPDNVQGAAGPFDHWPQSWGFDDFWGFLSGAAGQYDPIITQDNTTIGVQEGKDGGQYYFPDDLTDKAVQWLHGVRAQDARKPWFMYYSTSCAHAPHHVAKEWADKYRGKFDSGWDEYRRQTFERQKKLGVIPQGAELTERPDLFPAWESLTESEKKLSTRQMEVYASYQENADWNVGRLLDAIEEMGDLENTLIFYVWGITAWWLRRGSHGNGALGSARCRR